MGNAAVKDMRELVSADPELAKRGLYRGVRRLLPAWPALVSALVLSLIYGCTLQRSTGNAFSVNTTKFDYLGRVLGIGHPPGYPLYTLLNAAIVRVVPFGSVALRANLLSAIFAVLACMVAVRIFRELKVSRFLAAGGAIALGMLPALWRYAVVAEVYSFTILFVVAVLACVLIFESTGHRGWLRAGVLIFALSFAHATSNVLLIPGLLLYLTVRRPTWLVRPRELMTLLLAGALLAVGPYAYLPWRTAVGGSTWLETPVTDVPSLWAPITGARFSGRMFAVPLDQVLADRLPELWTAAFDQLGPLLAVSAVGLLVLARQRPLVGAVTAAWVLCIVVFALGYQVGDWQDQLVQAWLLLAIWAVVGLDVCAAAARVWARPVAVVVAVALPVTALLTGYASADRSGPDPQRGVDAAVAHVPDNSIIFTRNFETRHQFGYRLLPDGLGKRRNVWAAKGAVYARMPDQLVAGIREYCRPDPDPWVWDSREQPAAHSVPRGLHTFVYGHAYAKRVRDRGFAVHHVNAELYAFTCPRTAS